MSYDAATHIATLTPSGALSAGMTYTASLSGAKDMAGNMMSPMSWSFTTAAPNTGSQWTQTTVADFGAGARSNTWVSNTAGGELQLTRKLNEEFDGTALSSLWNVNNWSGSGTGTLSVANGIISLSRKQIKSKATFTNTPLEGRLAFGAAPYQHFGMGTDLGSPSNTWAIFSTGGTSNTLYARVNVAGSEQSVNLGTLPSGFHQYKVQPTSGGVQFYVDGVLKTTVAKALPSTTALRAVLSAYNGSPAAPIQASWVHTGYASSGKFTSSVLDTGKTSQWGTVDWTANMPAGTSVKVEVRTGNTATPDSTWSSWTTVSDGGQISNAAGRYLIYRVTLTTTNSDATPVFQDIVINWS